MSLSELVKTYAATVGETVIIPIDLERQTATPPWSNGVEIPLNVTGTGPFFGQMGVAPLPALGGVKVQVKPNLV